MHEPWDQRLAVLQARHPQADTAVIADVVRAVLSTMSGDLTARETTLLTEVEELGRTIANAKAEIAALRVDEITASHIPFATDELDAIVAHTAEATHAILACCETLDEVASAVTEAQASRLQDAVTRIYEACSFQDITGQRITKVVNTLKSIEAKVGRMTDTFGTPGEWQDSLPPETESSGDELLNGPQLPAMAMDQSDIDKLLASLD